MSKDKLNVLRYAGGYYVPRVLLKRFEIRVGQEYDQFVECLGELAVSSGQEDFQEYTRECMEKVNRGGLFPLNNTTFSLLCPSKNESRFFFLLMQSKDHHLKSNLKLTLSIK